MRATSAMKRAAWMPILVIVSLMLAPNAAAQSPANVLLVVNANSPESATIGSYYASRREIPANRIVQLSTTTAETLSRDDYERTVEAPIAEQLTRHNLQDEILYIVLTKGVPLRIVGTTGRDGSSASVDSELTLLYRKLIGHTPRVLGREDNPYFLGDRPLTDAAPFTRFQSDIYLVTRLDGFTLDDVLLLIDRGMAPVTDGQVVLDRRALMNDPGGDRWLLDAADRLENLDPGRHTVLEDTTAVADVDGAVLGYYSWGSNDPSNQRRQTGLAFANGALAGLFVSTDGRTFLEPPANWAPGPSTRPPGLFGSGSQTLAGDLIREGVTGVSAHVDEPFLDGTVRPQILFPAYLSGFSLVEAYYLATPYLSWKTLIIGDPLCAPFRKVPLTGDELSAPPDPTTELPGLFSERRQAVLVASGLKRDAVQRLLRAEVRRLQGDLATAETLLREAVDIEPRLSGANVQLAALHESRGEYEDAVARYRQAIEFNPTHTIALNNLAYALAVELDAPEEALPFARRAAELSSAPTILDTLAWVHHLLGNDREAARLLDRALGQSASNPEILIHAATVHAELGERVSARRELDAALTLDPSLAQRADVRALQARIRTPGAPAS